jgi:hypothetical protein
MSQSESEPTKPDLTTMGRPKKDENDLRRRWSVLNVTRSEREAIEAYAREAGCSTCSYIVSRALQRPVSPRQDWQDIVRQQAQLLQRLDTIAAALAVVEPVRDAGAALLALRRIEAEITRLGTAVQPMSDGDAGPL